MNRQTPLCAVIGCEAVDSLAVKHRHRVPREEPLRSAWLQRIGLRPSDKRKALFVCGRHFAPGDYFRNPQIMQKIGFAGRAVLKPKATPTFHLPTAPLDIEKQETTTAAKLHRLRLLETTSSESPAEAFHSALDGGHSTLALDAAAVTAAKVPCTPVMCEVGTQMVTIQYTLGTQASQRGRNAATQVHMGAKMQLSTATQTGEAANRRKRWYQ